MDERSVEWIWLLPPELGLELRSVPEALGRLLETRSAGGSSTPEALVAYGARPGELGDLRRYRATVVVRPQGDPRRALRGADFAHVERYCVLPSLRDARWLLPLDNRRAARRAMDFIGGFRSAGKPKKWLLSGLTSLGQLGRVGDTIVLAKRERSPLERALSAATHLHSPALALKTGAPSEHRQLVIQVTTPGGRPAAFAKLAASPGAREALTTAGERLSELGAYPTVGDFVPRVTHCLDVDGAMVLVQTPGPYAVGPTAYGPRHQEFLRALASATTRVMPLRDSEMWRTMQREHADLAPRVPEAWRGRLARAFRAMGSEGRGAPLEEQVALWMAHRDFSPWNTRAYPDGKLFVFDWEVAQPESVPFYDVMHFHLGTYALLARDVSVDAARALDLLRGARAAWRWLPESAQDETHLVAYLVDRSLSRLRYALSRPDQNRALQTDRFLHLVGEVLDRTTGEA